MDIVQIDSGEAVVRLLAEDAAILALACDEALANGEDFVKLGAEDDPLTHKSHYLRALRATLTAVSIGSLAQAYVGGKDLAAEIKELERLGFGRNRR